MLVSILGLALVLVIMAGSVLILYTALELYAAYDTLRLREEISAYRVHRMKARSAFADLWDGFDTVVHWETLTTVKTHATPSIT